MTIVVDLRTAFSLRPPRPEITTTLRVGTLVRGNDQIIDWILRGSVVRGRRHVLYEPPTPTRPCASISRHPPPGGLMAEERNNRLRSYASTRDRCEREMSHTVTSLYAGAAARCRRTLSKTPVDFVTRRSRSRRRGPVSLRSASRTQYDDFTLETLVGSSSYYNHPMCTIYVCE